MTTKPAFTLYDILLRASGLSQSEAANVHEARLDSVQKWCSGKSTPPDGVLRELAKLIVHQTTQADRALEIIEEEDAPETDAVVLGLARSDKEAQELGWPSITAQAITIAIVAAHVVDEGKEVEVVARDTFPIPHADG